MCCICIREHSCVDFAEKGHKCKAFSISEYLVNNVSFRWEIPTIFFPRSQLALPRFLNGHLVELGENY